MGSSREAVKGSKELDRVAEAVVQLRLQMLEESDRMIPFLERAKTTGVRHSNGGGRSELVDNRSSRPLTIPELLKVGVDWMRSVGACFSRGFLLVWLCAGACIKRSMLFIRWKVGDKEDGSENTTSAEPCGDRQGG